MIGAAEARKRSEKAREDFTQKQVEKYCQEHHINEEEFDQHFTALLKRKAEAKAEAEQAKRSKSSSSTDKLKKDLAARQTIINDLKKQLAQAQAQNADGASLATAQTELAKERAEREELEGALQRIQSLLHSKQLWITHLTTLLTANGITFQSEAAATGAVQGDNSSNALSGGLVMGRLSPYPVPVIRRVTSQPSVGAGSNSMSPAERSTVRADAHMHVV